MTGDTRPLEGVVVLDLTIALSGPYASLLLAGLGARVIKVENPKGGDPARDNAPYLTPNGLSLGRTGPEDMSLAALSRMRGKESVCIDLKSPDGRELFLSLAEKADLVIQNFSAGVLDSLGIGYESLLARNPRIVLASISGFGQGPDGAGKAMDSIIQSLSGTMMTSGELGDPPVRVGVPIADLTAPLFALIGSLAALYRVRETGVGEHVDVSMLGALTSLVSVEPWAALDSLGIPLRTGTSMPRLAPFGSYRASDGWISLCAPLDAFARGLYAALGQPELEVDPRFSSRDGRVRNASELDVIITAWTSAKTSAEVLFELEANGVPCAKVLDPREAVVQPRVLNRKETVPIAVGSDSPVPLHGPGIPIVFSGRPAEIDPAVPKLGEHTRSVLEEFLGLESAAVDSLLASGCIRSSQSEEVVA